MPIRVAIIDDEKPARDRIRRLLAAHPDFEIVGDGETSGRLGGSQGRGELGKFVAG